MVLLVILGQVLQLSSGDPYVSTNIICVTSRYGGQRTMVKYSINSIQIQADLQHGQQSHGNPQQMKVFNLRRIAYLRVIYRPTA